MLDDHAVSYGRQTNGKYIILLMLLALASLLGAWAMEHKGEVQSTLARLLPETQQPMDWQDAPSNGASSVFGCKDGAVLLTDGTLYHLNMDGAVTALLETGEDLLTPLSGSLPGAWGQSALYLWKDGAFSEIPVETGILGACANENFIAVISKGSGYLTCTKIMNAAGETLGTIGLTDAAMTELACTDSALAGLCMDKLGQWSLRIYDALGTLRTELPLGAENRCHILGAEEGFVVLGEHTVRCYSQDGEETGNVTRSKGTISCGTTAGENVAVLADCGNASDLFLVSPEGTVLGETELTAPVRGVTAQADRVYVLDYQALRVYDKQERLLVTDQDGARAANMGAYGSDLWLTGNGEFSRKSIS